MKLLTVNEAAEVLRVTNSLVYDLINAGKIIASRIGNGRGTLRIHEKDLERYVEESREAPQPRRDAGPRRQKLKHLKL